MHIDLSDISESHLASAVKTIIAESWSEENPQEYIFDLDDSVDTKAFLKSEEVEKLRSNGSFIIFAASRNVFLLGGEYELSRTITQLDLSNEGLTSLPAEIGQLTNLTELDLSGNQLSSLPVKRGQTPY